MSNLRNPDLEIFCTKHSGCNVDLIHMKGEFPTDDPQIRQIVLSYYYLECLKHHVYSVMFLNPKELESAGFALDIN